MPHKSITADDLLINESAIILVWFMTTDFCCLTHHKTNHAELLESKLVLAAPKKNHHITNQVQSCKPTKSFQSVMNFEFVINSSFNLAVTILVNMH